MNCPKCDQELQRRIEHGVEIDVCDRHGIWFDPGELDRYAAKDQKRRVPERASEYIATTMKKEPCPKCLSLTVLKGEIAGFVAQRCEVCFGMWIEPIDTSTIGADLGVCDLFTALGSGSATDFLSSLIELFDAM